MIVFKSSFDNFSICFLASAAEEEEELMVGALLSE
jgi:hypothetical protein